MEQWGWLIILVTISLVTSLIGKWQEKKKKEKAEQARRESAPPVRPPAPQPAAPAPVQKPPEPVRQPATANRKVRPAKRSVFEAMREDLRRATEPVVVPDPEPEKPKPVVSDYPDAYQQPEYDERRPGTGRKQAQKKQRKKMAHPRRSRGGLPVSTTPNDLRRAVIMAEVLDKPVGLRRSGGRWDPASEEE